MPKDTDFKKIQLLVLDVDADYITSMPGPRGAVREVIELILKKSGRWNQLMERYLPNK
jgi:3-deoxy-D-manno-octulosonate 8-phosphate phosphatase KdsC-like HAD superfamily phosphatase